MESFVARIRDTRFLLVLSLSLIVLVAAYFRLTDYADLARFNNDQVRDIGIVEAFAEGEWPLLGPKAGGTDFQLGPAFYYLEYVSGLLFGLTPAGTTLLVPLLALAALLLWYWLFRAYLTQPVALALVGLASVSAFLIKYARFGWNPNFLVFFLPLFLIALLRISDPDERRLVRWYLLAGISMGIGMQLHTLTLLLMPALFIIAHGYRSVVTRRLSLPQLSAALLAAALLFLPVFISEYRTGGANTAAFFAGLTAKTEAKADDLPAALVTADFFLQGQAVVLTGFEPRGQWVNPDAWAKVFTPANTLLLIFSILTITLGAWAAIYRFRSPSTSPAERRALTGLAILIALTGLLFLIIGNELNLRFFVLIAFIPYLLLGLALSAGLDWTTSRPSLRVALLSLALGIGVGLITSNLFAYRSTYDFDHPRSLTKAYGGISLGEARGLAEAIREALGKEPRYQPAVSTFDHERSIQYFLDRDDIVLDTIREQSSRSEGRWLILWRDAGRQSFEPFVGRFDATPIDTVGRFELYWLEPRH